jgi:hypothetical protein
MLTRLDALLVLPSPLPHALLPQVGAVCKTELQATTYRLRTPLPAGAPAATWIATGAAPLARGADPPSWPQGEPCMLCYRKHGSINRTGVGDQRAGASSHG